ncbi:MAG: hypothetical protein AAF317_18180 [Pseudomonadota bacterium]
MLDLAWDAVSTFLWIEFSGWIVLGALITVAAPVFFLVVLYREMKRPITLAPVRYEMAREMCLETEVQNKATSDRIN